MHRSILFALLSTTALIIGCSPGGGSSGNGGGGNGGGDNKPTPPSCAYAACGSWITDDLSGQGGSKERVQFILSEDKAEVNKTCTFPDQTVLKVSVSTRIKMDNDSVDVLDELDKTTTGPNKKDCTMSIPSITLRYKVESANVLVFYALGQEVGRLNRQSSAMARAYQLSFISAANP